MINAQVPVCRYGGAACVVLFASILKRATEVALMQLETLGFNAPGTADVEQARATLLSTEGATCVAVRNGEMAISYERGVKPLLQWISEGRSFEGWSVADKVVGKAPALLYVQLKPAAIFATAMSGDARTPCFRMGSPVPATIWSPTSSTVRGMGSVPWMPLSLAFPTRLKVSGLSAKLFAVWVLRADSEAVRCGG